jgi:hypothetical protein
MLSFALAIFLGAFLIFQVQPFIGKYILPWFGGTPSVWSTCMLFFQTLLLGGYLYAHIVATRLKPKHQAITHGVLLVAAMGVLGYQWVAWGAPVLPGEGFKPPDSDLPILRLLWLLVVSVGLPYFVLSSTGPLTQAWFNRVHPSRSPYRLYTLSNIGSLLALVSYPFVIEPLLKLQWQADLWAITYLLFAASMIWIATLLVRHRNRIEAGRPVEADTSTLPDHPPTWLDRALWLGFATAASAMLLAVTNQVCQEVAVIPFLWVVPLTIYLLSFIIVFAGDRWYSRKVWGVLFLASTVVTCFALFDSFTLPIMGQVAVYSALLFALCMVCHGEMVGLRPHPRYLTSFYLLMSAGGALGGAFVSLVAPVIFSGFWELHVSLWLAWALFLVVILRADYSWINQPGMTALKKVVAGLLLLLAGTLYGHTRYAHDDALYCERSFYGVLRVRHMGGWDEEEKALKLSHGAIVHGFQYTTPARRMESVSYYGPGSGIALTLTEYPKWLVETGQEHPMKVGIIGLGVGTLATFGQPGDLYRFYEINPSVIALSQGPEAYFTYLKETRARVEVVDGDARISLERELQEGNGQNFDVLAVDAFSSDSIPAHLLTHEALKLYMMHLRPNGVLVLHISNRHLDLRPVVAGLARQEGLLARIIESDGDDKGSWGSTWVLVTDNREFAARPEILDAESDHEARSDTDVWTDDYSNIYQILN